MTTGRCSPWNLALGNAEMVGKVLHNLLWTLLLLDVQLIAYILLVFPVILREIGKSE